MSNLKLLKEQKEAYRKNGYLKGLPVFNGVEVKELNEGLQELSKLLKPGESHFHINTWHRSSRWLYDVCTHPQILNYVEDILGSNYYLWGSHFFSKAPGSQDKVAWHQDAPYWPLAPHNSVTVWLAFTDVDEENGAMKIIPGTHRAGLIKHNRSHDNSNVLAMELDRDSYNEEDAVSLNLKAGQISIHDDAAVHGSPANLSNRWRIGLTIRYSSTDVKCLDTTAWPKFRAYLARGTDEYNHNPKGVVPVEKYARL